MISDRLKLLFMKTSMGIRISAIKRVALHLTGWHGISLPIAFLVWSLESGVRS